MPLEVAWLGRVGHIRVLNQDEKRGAGGVQPFDLHAALYIMARANRSVYIRGQEPAAQPLVGLAQDTGHPSTLLYTSKL